MVFLNTRLATHRNRKPPGTTSSDGQATVEVATKAVGLSSRIRSSAFCGSVALGEPRWSCLGAGDVASPARSLRSRPGLICTFHVAPQMMFSAIAASRRRVNRAIDIMREGWKSATRIAGEICPVVCLAVEDHTTKSFALRFMNWQEISSRSCPYQRLVCRAWYAVCRE